MKKGIRIGAGVLLMLLAVLVLLVLPVLMKFNEDYTSVIEKNWDIEIPGNYETEYEVSDEPSIFGDGYRYHVLSGSSSDVEKLVEQRVLDNIEMVKVTDSTDKNSGMHQIMDELCVPEDQRPSQNLNTYRMMSGSGDAIYITVDIDGGKVYVAESFL